MAGIKLLKKNPPNLNFLINELLRPEIRIRLFDDVYGRAEVGLLLADPSTAIYGIFERGLPRPTGCVILTGIIPYRNCFLYAVIFDKENRKQGKLSSVMNQIKEDAVKKFALHSVTAYIIDKNPGSETLLKKMGFVKKDVREEAVFTNGKYKDLTTFYLLLKPPEVEPETEKEGKGEE